MSEDATTLMARDETSGRMYPMFLERVFFVLAIVGFFVLQPIVMGIIDAPSWASLAAGWCGLPIALMFMSELVGRLMQRLLSN
ncbi:hypothetical protein N9L27_05515 [Candidatus Poseidoniales archaeon]|nr:hypothetical protein [Candidatus Poseidoniales archaeon]